MNFSFIKNRWIFLINVLLTILTFGGFIGFVTTGMRVFMYFCVTGILVLPVYIIIFILYKMRMLKEVGISIALTIIILVFLGMVGSIAVYMSKSTENVIDSNAWLSFLGALTGSSITVFGTYILTQMQFKNNLRYTNKIKDEKDRDVQRMILKLLSREIQENKHILRSNILRTHNQKNYVKTLKSNKFKTEKWMLVRKDLMQFISINSLEQLFFTLDKFYDYINKFNIKTNSSYIKLSNRNQRILLKNFSKKLMQTGKILNEMIELLDNSTNLV